MATPLFNALNLDFSYTLQDPVAAAANDGVTYTSALRTLYLNRASATLWNIIYYSAKKTFRLDNVKLNRFADFLIDVTGNTDASGRISISSLSKALLIEVIELVGTTSPAKRLKVIGKGEIGLSSSAIDPQYIPATNNPIAYINAGYIYLLPAANYNTQPYRMVYLEYPMTYAVNTGVGGTEIEWNASFYESLKLLGLAHALLDDGKPEAYQAIYNVVAQEYVQDIAEMQERKKT